MSKLSSQITPALARFGLTSERLSKLAAPAALALFAIVGFLNLDDYGVGWDERAQRYTGAASLDYILGDEDALPEDHNRYYTVAYELPLAAAERVFRPDSREVYLSRHLITHLFFLAGGFFSWLLAYRLFGSRAAALLAMLIFLLHPRIYAQSFFNTKDVPFLAAFMLALYLIHRAFRRDTVAAFALCGAGVGLLAGVRLLGVALIPAVLGMFALDLIFPRKGGDGRARIVALNAAAFVLAAAAVIYAAFPYIWTNPLRLLDGLSTLSQHPTVVAGLFQGEPVYWPNIPWSYIPVWVLITTPPVALVLAAAGGFSVVLAGAADWRAALRNSDARFGLFILAALALPVAAVIALDSNLYDGWRQMYFLHAPLCVLAAFGLRWLTTAFGTRRRLISVCAFALAAAGLAWTVVDMIRIHPYQNDYFSPLLARSADRPLSERYTMDYNATSRREAMEYLLERYPDDVILLADQNPAANRAIDLNRQILPPAQRERVFDNPDFAGFVIDGEDGDTIFTRRVYDSVILTIADVREKRAAEFWDAYRTIKASRPAAESAFDIYMDDEALTYLKEPCAAEDARGRFFLSIVPKTASDLPPEFRELGHESLNFDFGRRGAMLDGVCMMRRALPGYPISVIETGQRLGGRNLWLAAARADSSWSDAYRDARRQALARPPAARSDFDVYMLEDGGARLVYIKRQCGESDDDGRFLLSVFPESRGDLPPEFRELGHESLNFDFPRYGARLGEDCVIIRALPEYPIRAIETGQWIPGGGRLWTARFDVVK